MSKAFTREDDGNDELEGLGDEEPGADEGEAAPVGTRNYMTPQGAQRLRDELHDLLHKERPKVVETVAWAAGNGDRSENADYIYGKRRLREIDRRLRFLQRRLDAAQIVDPAAQTADRVLFGATVTVQDEEAAERVYQIVGIDETDAKRGRVSWISPIGKALLQAKVGDVVLLKTPKGEEELEIIAIEYRAIGD
jgi:transcription elongation factor GreB